MSSTHIGCPACVSFFEFNSEDDAMDTVNSHNEKRHGGEKVARVIEPDSKDSVNEFVDASRENTSREQLEKLIRKIARGETPFTVGVIE